MKIQLLTLNFLDYYSFNVLLTALLLPYTQTKEGGADFANCAGTISASIENIPSFIKTDLIFPPCPALPYTSETIAEKDFNTHYLVKLNINKYEIIQNNLLIGFKAVFDNVRVANKISYI